MNKKSISRDVMQCDVAAHTALPVEPPSFVYFFYAGVLCFTSFFFELFLIFFSPLIDPNKNQRWNWFCHICHLEKNRHCAKDEDSGNARMGIVIVIVECVSVVMRGMKDYKRKRGKT